MTRLALEELTSAGAVTWNGTHSVPESSILRTPWKFTPEMMARIGTVFPVLLLSCDCCCMLLNRMQQLTNRWAWRLWTRFCPLNVAFPPAKPCVDRVLPSLITAFHLPCFGRIVTLCKQRVRLWRNEQLVCAQVRRLFSAQSRMLCCNPVVSVALCSRYCWMCREDGRGCCTLCGWHRRFRVSEVPQVPNGLSAFCRVFPCLFVVI
jgi:hypothetical protein